MCSLVLVLVTAFRLGFHQPFAAWDGKDYTDMPVLIKALGKCTSDHISMAGPWLMVRGRFEVGRETRVVCMRGGEVYVVGSARICVCVCVCVARMPPESL